VVIDEVGGSSSRVRYGPSRSTACSRTRTRLWSGPSARLLDTVVDRWDIANPVVVDVRTASVMATASDVMDAVWEWREAQTPAMLPATLFPRDRIAGGLPLFADAVAGTSSDAPAILRRRYGPEV
jgi:nucleoside-triphosphatase